LCCVTEVHVGALSQAIVADERNRHVSGYQLVQSASVVCFEMVCHITIPTLSVTGARLRASCARCCWVSYYFGNALKAFFKKSINDCDLTSKSSFALSLILSDFWFRFLTKTVLGMPSFSAKVSSVSNFSTPRRFARSSVLKTPALTRRSITRNLGFVCTQSQLVLQFRIHPERSDQGANAFLLF